LPYVPEIIERTQHFDLFFALETCR